MQYRENNGLNDVERFYDEKAEQSGVSYEYERWKSDLWRLRDYKQTASVYKCLIEKYVHGEVLEVGCGPGTWTEFLLSSAGQISVMDISAKMIGLTQERYAAKITNGIQGDFTDHSFHRGKVYNAVFSSRAFEYMDKIMAVETLALITKSDGWCVIATKNPAYLHKRVADFQHKLSRKGHNVGLHDDWVSYGKFRRLLRENGFVEVKVLPVIFDIYLPFMRFKTIRLISLWLSWCLWLLFHGLPMNFLVELFVESYVIVARKR